MRKTFFLITTLLLSIFLATTVAAESACTCEEGLESVCQETACTGDQTPNPAGNYPAGCAESTQVCCCEAESTAKMPTVPPDLSWNWELQISSGSAGLLTGSAIEDVTGPQLEAGYKFYEGTDYKHFLTKFESGTFDGIEDKKGIAIKLVGDEPDSIGQVWCLYLARSGSTLNLILAEDQNGKCDGESETVLLSEQKAGYAGGSIVWSDPRFGVAIDTTRDFVDIALDYEMVGCDSVEINYDCIVCLLIGSEPGYYGELFPNADCSSEFVCEECINDECLGDCIIDWLEYYYCDGPPPEGVPEFNTTGAIMASLVMIGLGVVAIKNR